MPNMTNEQLLKHYSKQCPHCRTRLEKWRKECYVCGFPVRDSDAKKNQFMERVQAAEEAKRLRDEEHEKVRQYVQDNALCRCCGLPLDEDSRPVLTTDYDWKSIRCLCCGKPDPDRIRYGSWRSWDDVRAAVREQHRQQS